MRRCFGILMTALLLLSVSVAASAQDTREQEAKKARLEREIEIIDKQLAENASRSNAMLSTLDLIRKKISNRKTLIADSDRKIQKYSDDIYLKQRQINRLQARIDVLTDHYSKLVLSAYKNRDSRIWYMYMLASENLGQAFRRYSYFKNLSSQMNDEARKIKDAKEELLKEKDKLARLKKEAQAVKAGGPVCQGGKGPSEEQEGISEAAGGKEEAGGCAEQGNRKNRGRDCQESVFVIWQQEGSGGL